jgi:hypothetical protein
MVDALNLGRSKCTVVVHLINESRSGTKLNCGIHDCPQRCHQLYDHSKMECHKLVESICSRNHRLSRLCFKKDPTCRVCETENCRQELKRQRDHKLEIEREIKQKEYAQHLAELQDEIAHERHILRDQSEQNEREKVLQQHQQDLASLKMKNSSLTLPENEASTTAASPGATPNSTLETKQAAAEDQHKVGLDVWSSSAKGEWKHQKEFEGARNEALDSLMDMIGLENVKDKFLSIKSKIDTAVRQNVNMKEERFGAVLLGNPGTGACWLSYRVL